MDFELETTTEIAKLSRADLLLMHARFGHVSEHTLRQILVPKYGFKKQIPKVNLLPCVICNLYKSRNQHRTLTYNRASNKLQKLHMDLAILEQSSNTDDDISTVFLIIVDDFSGFIWTFPLHDKSDAAKTIIQFIKDQKRSIKHKIEEICTDDGGEFCAKVLQDFFKKLAIQHTMLAPGIPAQNGTAERSIQSVMTMAKTMLATSKLGYEFRHYAIECATFIKNCLPIRTRENKSAYEWIYQKAPDLSRIRAFGSRVFAKKTTNCGKFYPNADAWLLIGYEADGKILLLLDPVSNRILRRGNVKVDESCLFKTLRETPELNLLNNRTQDTTAQNQEPSQQQKSTTLAPQNIDGDISESNILKHKRRKNSNTNSALLATLTEKIDIPKSYKQAMSSPHSKEWKKAQNNKFKNLETQKTWIPVPRDKNINPLRTMWVYTYKHDIATKLQKFKARLVVLGNRQTFNVNYSETFSPTPSFPTIRFVIALAAFHSWKLYSLDVSCAYVQAPLHDNIHIFPPSGYNIAPNLVLKLEKALYGLKQAGREWYMHLSSLLNTYGLQTSTFDPCLFFQTFTTGLLVILIYVDDIMITGSTQTKIDHFRNYISSKLVLKDFGTCTEYLNIVLEQTNEHIALSQEHYIDSILNDHHYLDL